MKRHWAIRTVRKSTIKLDHITWQPSEVNMKYDGRLDNQRFLFARYPSPHEDLVSLWGTEQAAKGATEPLEGPQVVNGTFPWIFWHPIKR